MECKNCKTELTYMKESKCLRCLKCNPITASIPPEEKEKNYVDVPWTRERIEKVCEEVCKRVFRGLLEDWHVRKPDEDIDADLTATEAAKRVGIRQPDNPPESDNLPAGNPELEWRKRAKELGIPLCKETGGSRKKVDVLKDIEEKLTVPA